jgi:hypothetical protein
MTRVVSVGRSKGAWLAAALGFAFLAPVLMSGCPGTLDPNEFPSGGAAGAMGTAGMPGNCGAPPPGLPGCDIMPLLADDKGRCATSGCHDDLGSSGSFSMATADWMTHVVDVIPHFDDSVLAPSICAKDTQYMNMPYIKSGCFPAQGLFILKLNGAVCGQDKPDPLDRGFKMPLAPGKLDAAGVKCFQDWANKLAAGQ